MIYVVVKETGKILNKCDAWLRDGEEVMLDWARENGYTPLNGEITSMGDMIIWVK